MYWKDFRNSKFYDLDVLFVFHLILLGVIYETENLSLCYAVIFLIAQYLA